MLKKKLYFLLQLITVAWTSNPHHLDETLDNYNQVNSLLWSLQDFLVFFEFVHKNRVIPQKKLFHGFRNQCQLQMAQFTFTK